MSKKILFILTLFMSGFCGISYEILYSRMLGNIIGNHFVLNASILIIFLLGVGLGTKIAHKLSGYLWLVEGLIGFYALIFGLSYPLFDTLFFKILPNNIYYISSITILLLFIPTILIGISLPLFSEYFKEIEKSDKIFDLSYSIYNIGAFITAFAIEFYLIREFGIKKSLFLIASLNILTSISLIYLFGKKKVNIIQENIIQDKNIIYPLILISIASAIFQLLILKIAELIFGPFNETFAMVVSLTLLGIALGSFISYRIKISFNFLALTNIISLAFFVVFFKDIMLQFSSIYKFFPSENIIILKMLTLSIFMLWSSISFGGAIPTLMKKELNVAKESGHLLFISSLANALGYILMLLAIHPYFKYGQIILIISLLIFFALILHNKFETFYGVLTPHEEGIGGSANVTPETPEQSSEVFSNKNSNSSRIGDLLSIKNKKIIGLALISNIVLLFGIYFIWNENSLYLHYMAYSSKKSFLSSLYSYKEGSQYKKYQDVFSINTIGRNKYFFINGYVSMALNDSAEYIVGIVSSLVTPKRNEALILGLGSGATAGTVNEIFNKTDAVEINPVVIEHQEDLKQYNFNIHHSKKAHIICDDGIRFIKNTNKKYDLILNTVTSPLYFGASKLYTIDFFKLVKEKLTEEGVYTTWIDSRIGKKGLEITLNSLKKEFKYSWVSMIKGSYYVLVCSNKPLAIHQKEKIEENNKLKEYLMKNHARSIKSLKYSFVSDNTYKAIKRINPEEDDYQNTLDKPELEFSLSKRVFGSNIRYFIKNVFNNYNIENLKKNVFNNEVDEYELVKYFMQDAPDSRFSKIIFKKISSNNKNFYSNLKIKMIEEYEQALLKYKNKEIMDEIYYLYNYFEEYDKLEKLLKKEISLFPNYDYPYVRYGEYFIDKKDYTKAIELIKKSIELNKENNYAYFLLGKIYYEQKEFEKAKNYFYISQKLNPVGSNYYYYLGDIYYKQGDLKKAEKFLRDGVELFPDDIEDSMGLLIKILSYK
ncbi:MAG: tetratricopeptide repeat protein [Candidatus Sericytochromatia bacterium]